MLPSVIQKKILERVGLKEAYSHNSEYIASKIGVGTTTVKRFFGLLSEKENNRKHSASTLYIVAMFLGFNNVKEMNKYAQDEDNALNSISSILSIDISRLKAGMRMNVCFRPRLEVEMTYLGNGEFEVRESKDGDFSAGDKVRLWTKMAS